MENRSWNEEARRWRRPKRRGNPPLSLACLFPSLPSFYLPSSLPLYIAFCLYLPLPSSLSSFLSLSFIYQRFRPSLSLSLAIKCYLFPSFSLFFYLFSPPGYTLSFSLVYGLSVLVSHRGVSSILVALGTSLPCANVYGFSQRSENWSKPIRDREPTAKASRRRRGLGSHDS